MWPDRTERRLPRAVTSLVCGDSITAIAEVALAATSVTNNGDGTATIVRTAHSLAVGQPVRLGACATTALNLMDAEVSVITDANTFKVPITGRTHTVTSGGSPTIYFPYRRSSRGWYNWMEYKLGRMFDATWCATGGADASDLLALLLATNQVEIADVGFLCCGMNDVYSNGDSAATIQANLTLLLDELLRRCKLPVILSVPPRSSANGSWSAGKQTIHSAVNRWLYAYAEENGAVWIDTWRATHNGATYVDGAASDPDPVAAMTQDGVHPSFVGAVAIGTAVANALSSMVGTTGWTAAHPDAISADTGNIITTGAFLTDTDGVATGWASSDSTANMTVTPTVAARTVADAGDACGKNQILTIDYGTATGTASTRFRLNNIHASLTAGTVVQFRIRFSLSGAAGLSGLGVELFGAVGSNFWLVYANNPDSNADVLTGSLSGYFMTPPAEVPSGLTDLDIWVRPYITSAQSSSLVLKLWQPELIVVT